MFITRNVPALFKKGTLKLVETDDGYRRVAEATLVIEPFEATLARELGEEIAAHLFDESDEIRDELDSIDLRVRAGNQTAVVRPHKDLDACATLEMTTIKDVTVCRVEDKKTGRNWLACSFVLTFSLEKRASRNFVLDEFGKRLLWNFDRVQPEMFATAAPALEQAAEKRPRGTRAH